MLNVAAANAAAWDGPGATEETRKRFTWHALVWFLVFPKRRHRIALTIPGLFLMGLAMGIGTAAYNTASNILFITLSLLLACLLLSGLLSWFNFKGMCWRMLAPGAWRAGHETLVTVEVANRKRWLPTYSLWFELAAQPEHIPDPAPDGRQLKLREILNAAEKHILRGQVYLRDRVEAGSTVTLDWGLKPAQRGAAVVELTAVGSLFPFGFLKKRLGTDVKHRVLVWPAQVEYQWNGAAAAQAGNGRRAARVGTGDDLLALRKYELGDSHRLIHWKASARLGQLMIRQFAAETHEGYVLRLTIPAALWPRPEQFELLCSFAATLAEDLFAAGRLRGVMLDDGIFRETRRLRDVESWLDALARLEFPGRANPSAAAKPMKDKPEVVGDDSPYRSRGGPAHAGPPPQKNNLITFAPEGARGVAAYVDGRKTASA